MKLDSKFFMYAALACGVAYLVLEAQKSKSAKTLGHAESMARRAIDFGIPLLKLNPVAQALVSTGLKNVVNSALLK